MSVVARVTATLPDSQISGTREEIMARSGRATKSIWQCRINTSRLRAASTMQPTTVEKQTRTFFASSARCSGNSNVDAVASRASRPPPHARGSLCAG